LHADVKKAASLISSTLLYPDPGFLSTTATGYNACIIVQLCKCPILFSTTAMMVILVVLHA